MHFGSQFVWLINTILIGLSFLFFIACGATHMNSTGEMGGSSDFQLTHYSNSINGSNSESGCYDPLSEPLIMGLYGTDFLDRIEPLLAKAYHLNNVDPRILFHRMIGESGGDPDAYNPTSRAYGIFQVLGSFLNKRPHETRIRELYKKHGSSSVSQRQYVQVMYHVEYFIPEAVEKIGYGTKCNTFGFDNDQGQRIWNKMSPRMQSISLNWGSCKNAAINAEAKVLRGEVASYDTSIINTFINDEMPLCSSFTTN